MTAAVQATALAHDRFAKRRDLPNAPRRVIDRIMHKAGRSRSRRKTRRGSSTSSAGNRLRPETHERHHGQLHMERPKNRSNPSPHDQRFAEAPENPYQRSAVQTRPHPVCISLPRHDCSEYLGTRSQDTATLVSQQHSPWEGTPWPIIHSKSRKLCVPPRNKD